ncbi:hypothetical protein [Saccharothrix sp. NRRL B-16348]|uniref:hypothetical protein n=1 Tax=Saccharothrix sp. NRRL B-16348 TaxID=1415542 RepID=UPI000AEF4A25|nr:hypothetical protein [Saccharothrix sp. NRRL B-16348]
MRVHFGLAEMALLGRSRGAEVARVVLPGAGDVPRVESPGSFGWAVLAHPGR